MSGRTKWLGAGLVLAIVWCGALAYTASQSWPRVPLDISANDPATRAAFQRAVQAHVVQHAVIALGGAVVLIGGAWLVSRRRG